MYTDLKKKKKLSVAVTDYVVVKAQEGVSLLSITTAQQLALSHHRTELILLSSLCE